MSGVACVHSRIREVQGSSDDKTDFSGQYAHLVSANKTEGCGWLFVSGINEHNTDVHVVYGTCE
jgi:hypothetical protein